MWIDIANIRLIIENVNLSALIDILEWKYETCLKGRERKREREVGRERENWNDLTSRLKRISIFSVSVNIDIQLKNIMVITNFYQIQKVKQRWLLNA